MAENTLSSYLKNWISSDSADTTKKKAKTAKSKTSARPPAVPPNNIPPAPMGTNLQEMVYAATNPEYIHAKSYKGVLRSDTDAFGVLRNLSVDKYKNDYSEGIVRYLATVLRVENKGTVSPGTENEASAFGWFDSLLASVSPAANPPAPPVEITAVVDCGIHAGCFGKLGIKGDGFSLPNESGQGGSNKAITLIRDGQKGLFTATDSRVETPLVGELVWVTWQDLKNYRGGVYLGPLISRLPPAQGAGSRATAAAGFNARCFESAPPGGSSKRSSNSTATSKTGNSVRKPGINAKKERGKKPIGKGVFTGFPDIKTHEVKAAVEATLSWVCFDGIVQEETSKKKVISKKAALSKAQKFVKEYQKKGIKTYIMGYPIIGHEEVFINDLINMASKVQTIGVIINLDSYIVSGNTMNNETRSERASYLIQTLKKTADEKGFCVGLTASNLTNNTRVPWKVFVSTEGQGGVDFVVPQVLAQSYTRTKESFVSEFRPWKILGFKHIIPALGMIGKSPPENGWREDGYNTIEKSPWRFREDATWTFNEKDSDSVINQLGKETMANAVIWWDWAGANVSSKDWPEKRWDIIRELGNAEAAAEKLNSLSDSQMDEADKERIKNLPLGEYMKRSEAAPETQKKKTANAGNEVTAAPAPSKPSEGQETTKDAEAQEVRKQLSKKEKEEIQKEIDEKQKEIKQYEDTIKELKSDLQKASSSGEGVGSAGVNIAAVAEQIKQQNKLKKEKESELSKLRAKLGKTEETTPPTAPNYQRCVTDASGRIVLNHNYGGPLQPGQIKQSQLGGIPFHDVGFVVGPPFAGLASIIIHEPGGGGGSVSGVVRSLKNRRCWRPDRNSPNRVAKCPDGLSVHFIVNSCGGLTQYVSMKNQARHAGGFNGVSIGIEVVNGSPFGAPSKQYRPGTMQQMEGTYRLVKMICANAGISTKIHGGTGPKMITKHGHAPGVNAHGSIGGHSDGRFPTLYCALRQSGLKKVEAYKKALQIGGYEYSMDQQHKDAAAMVKRYCKEGKYSSTECQNAMNTQNLNFAEQNQRMLEAEHGIKRPDEPEFVSANNQAPTAQNPDPNPKEPVALTWQQRLQAYAKKKKKCKSYESPDEDNCVDK